ncbi:MAG: MaoC family dehydratase [Pseudomonadota bacterium]
MRVYSWHELTEATGEILAVSDWLTIDQTMIDAFAEATGDHQWIHVDVPRATAEIGGPIAHGYLTLSLIPRLRDGLFQIAGTERMINYGLDRVRFPAPVPAGARVRLVITGAGTEETAHGLRLALDATIEIEGSARPACVARTLTLLVPAR